ncbi:hypothetical protein PHMEG_0004908 [Phytophthora megakarya]|uniref:Uncharacterized protein n=1 Tax=Phytophthora megakarya TaxID=4795 RepID=A0A225WUA0_9STRA|nr:hypothetical protein PHMEG_0004908 [Phytophthora megakarya]
MVHKRNSSVDASNVLFLRLVRVKTLELVGNHPAQAAPTATTLSLEIPVVALLNMPLALPLLLHPHVRTQASLTFHSVRRGGAKHANGCGEMTARWIFNRGSWNMSTTNKGFNYIFNTSKEDHKIAKVLSGYKPKDAVSLQDLSSFDAQTLESIVGVQRVLYSSCYKLEAERYNVNKKVLNVLTTCVVRHFPLLKSLNPGSPVVKRVEVAVKPKEPSQDQKIIDHQAAVIKYFIEHINRQDARMDALEAKQTNDPIQATNKRSCQEEDKPAVGTPKKKQHRGSVTHLHATWFAWYTQEPKWMAHAPKQQRSKAKILVAFMKLFLHDGFALDSNEADYRDQVLDLV